MDLNASAPYEFLDLTDIDDNERKQLICTLYKTAKEDTNSLNATSNKSKKTPHGTSSNTNKDYNNSKHSRYESGKHVKNIAAINLTQQLTPTNEKATSTHVVRNLMIPRFITPIALPYCAVVKPTLAEVAVVPLRTPALTAGAAASTHVESGLQKTKTNRKGTNQPGFTMAAHSSVSHHQQSQQQQQQQQQQSHQSQQQPQTQPNQPHILNNSSQQQSSTGQGSQSNQNSNYPAMHPSQSVAYNHLPPGVYLQSHGGAPVGGAMYQMLPTAALSPNVYVNNVTANVSLHGYVTQPVPQYISPNGTPAYVSSDVQQANPQLVNEQPNQIVQQTSSVAISRTTTRRGGRSRGNNNGQRRNDFQQRQQQANNTQQEVVGSPVDPQAINPGAGYSQFFQYAYPQYYGGHPNISHQQTQHAAGPPVYFTGPVYAGNHVYPVNYQPGVIYQTIVPQDYSLMDDKGEEQPPQEGLMPQMWHQPIPYEFSEGYMPHEIVEDVNHNPSPLNSTHTPSMLSPILQPMFDGHVQPPMEIQQHMNELHIYDTSSLSQQSLQSDDQMQDCQHLNEMVTHEQIEHQALTEQHIMIEQNIPEDNEKDLNIINNNEPHIIQTMEEQNMSHLLVENEFIPQSSEQTSIVSSPQSVTAIQYGTIHDSIVNVPNMSNSVELQQEQQIQHEHHLQQQQHQEQEQNHEISQTIEYHQEQQQQQQPQQQHIPNVELEIINNDKEISDEVVKNDESALKVSQKPSVWNITKKTTASVSVTALPATANKQAVITSNVTVTNGTKSSPPAAAVNGCVSSVTLQTTQMKSHGVMKVPSSPPTDMQNSEKKALLQLQPVSPSFPQPSVNTVNEVTKTVTTTSIASTVVPQQLQENKENNKISQVQGLVETKKLESVNAETAKNLQKAHLEKVTKPKEEITSSTLPPAQTTAQPKKPTSWASLFQDKSNATTNNQQQTIGTSTASQASKKPIAKVLPFEGTSNFVPTAPGTLSYSAASAQGLPNAQPSNVNNTTKGKLTTSVAPMVANMPKEGVDEWSLKFAEFLTKYKTDFTPVSLRPRGLTNRSNYCYINSILQALVGCPPFYNLMKAIPKQPPGMFAEKPHTPTINAMVDFINEFSHLPPGARLLTRREKAHKKDDNASDLQCDPAFEPTAIYKLWNANRSEDEGRQEDAEEFLGFVLNKLNDEMLEVMKLIAKPAPDHNGDANVEGDDGGDWQVCDSRNKGSVTRQTDFGRTPLSDIFHGEVRSKLQRGNEYSTYVIQPFFTLPLNIEKVSSVKEALELLVGRDQLEGVTCSKTNQEINAWQQMNLEKLPVVLILHLKWFDYKMEGCTKILKTVEFPVELKIDTKILASKKYSQKQKLYRLFAVVYHDGKEATKGHYITDLHHAGYLSWLRFDDSSVKPISEHNVLRPRAPRVPYLLYYRRCDTVPNSTQNVNNK